MEEAKDSRVVVTGLGVITSIGEDLEVFWENCLDGMEGVTPIKENNLTLLQSTYGGQVHGFDPEKYVTKNHLNDIGRGSHLLIASMKEAIANSGLEYREYKNGALVVGTTMGEVSTQETHLNTKRGLESSYFLKDQNNLHTLLSNASREFELKGQTYLIGNACASGNYAIITAFEKIKSGKNKVAFAVGVDPFSTVAYYGFHRLNAMTPKNCSPFDKNRKGMIVAEGAACLILEDYNHAVNRQATIYAEIAGYGISTDAHHITAPHPEGEGILKSMNMALASADITPSEVNYISAHGTGTLANDRVEGKAINKLFGSETPVSSIKSMLGHSMGAASAIESVACCLAIRDQIAPPTINFETPDDEILIDCIPNNARRFPINIALNNSSAFGGMNASVIFKGVSQV